MAQDVYHSDLAFAQPNGVNIAYDTFGDPSSKPLLLIMGLGWQMIFWDDDFCSRLASKGYRVIRFDNRDIGLSQRFDEAGIPDIGALISAQLKGTAFPVPYTLSDMAADAVGLLDVLEIDSAHVVGASMGGMIAQIMAMQFTERVRTLTSIMSSTGDPDLPPPRPEALKILYTPLPTDREGFIKSYINVLRVLSGPEVPVSESQARKYAEMTFDRGLSPDGVARQFAAVIASGSRKEGLKSVTLPTLIIHGDKDPLVPVECGIDTAKAIPGARLVIMKGMGHGLPEVLWDRMIDEIASHAK